MNTYEAMFLINSKLDEKSTNTVFEQIQETISKQKGEISSARIWAEKRKLTFLINKNSEANYYLVNFKLPPEAVTKIKQAYRLNENILRVLITTVDEKQALSLTAKTDKEKPADIEVKKESNNG